MLIMEIQTSFSRHWEAAGSLQKQDDLERMETGDQEIMSLCHFVGKRVIGFGQRWKEKEGTILRDILKVDISGLSTWLVKGKEG